MRVRQLTRFDSARRLTHRTSAPSVTLRPSRHYGSDDASYAKIGSIKLEFVETPPEDLLDKIDALACVLPDADVRPEDRVRECDISVRVETVEAEWLFGLVTHKVLKLVRLLGS